jgi:NTP pyrophosphatase (non-canonical NTP hydrolase)
MVKFESMDPIKSEITEAVLQERIRQINKHGREADHHTPELWLVILAEEFGEVSHAVLEKDWTNYEEELVQVAAVAFAALEDLYKQRGEKWKQK